MCSNRLHLYRSGRVWTGGEFVEQDLLVVEGKIICSLSSDKSLELHSTLSDVSLEVHDLEGLLLIPGLVDGHVHFAGASGEQGPRTRTPDISALTFLETGITTVIGLLGTDHYSRSLSNLLTRTRELREQGLNAYCLTGSYKFPPISLLSSNEDDIFFLNEVIGAGEIAVSDYRSSNPQAFELRRFIQDTLRAARAKGIKGCIVFHLGDDVQGLAPILSAIEGASMLSDRIICTHINRNKELLEQAASADTHNVWLDLTAIYFDEDKPGNFSHVEEAINFLYRKNPQVISRVTVTSDAGTSIGPGLYTKPSWLFRAFKACALDTPIGLKGAIKIFCENNAKALGLSDCGFILPGYRADFVAIDDKYDIVKVISNGVVQFNRGTYCGSSVVEASYR